METKNDLFRVVRDAEQKRVGGQYDVAILFVSELKEVVDTEAFSSFDDESKLAIQQLHRIWVTSWLSLANKELNGNEAMVKLDRAGRVIETYYKPNVFVEFAKETTKDHTGNEYLMYAEQQRDVARHNLACFEITGNAAFFEQSIAALQQALAHSEYGSSAHLLALMERYQAEQQKPKEAKGSMRPSLTWGEYTNAYLELVEVSHQTGNWDRLATVSAYFLEQAVKQKNLSLVNEAIKNLNSAQNETGVSAWKYVSKNIAKIALGTIKKTTYTK